MSLHLGRKSNVLIPHRRGGSPSPIRRHPLLYRHSGLQFRNCWARLWPDGIVSCNVIRGSYGVSRSEDVEEDICACNINGPEPIWTAIMRPDIRDPEIWDNNTLEDGEGSSWRRYRERLIQGFIVVDEKW